MWSRSSPPRTKRSRSFAPRTNVSKRRRLMAPTVTQQQVLDALKGVRCPGLSRDIVSFGCVHDLKIEDGNVRLTIRFQTENPAIGQQLARDAEAAVKKVEGVREVDIHVDVVARTGTASSAAGGQKGMLENVRYKVA